MIIGAAQLLLNYPTIFIGSAGLPAEELDRADPSAAVVSSDEHVMLRARQQVAPVSVTIWNGIWAGSGSVVFDGDLSLGDASIAVFDLDRLASYTRVIGSAGVHRVCIAVDDPGVVSRIHVAVDPGRNTCVIGAVAGYELPAVSGVSGASIAPATELGLILAGYDRPMARLVCALKLIFFASPSEVSRRDAINFSRVQNVVEWLRWLSPRLSLHFCNELGALIRTRLTEDFSDGFDSAAIILAQEIWELIEW